MPTHKALILDAKHGKFVLRENETPTPGPGDLLVRIQAVGLNPVDWMVPKYGMFVDEYPTILGTDIAGIVEEIGEGVESFKKGDRIFYQGSWSLDRAGFQEYNLITAETASKIPDQFSFEQVATIPVAFSAAFLGLFNDKPHGAGYAAAALDASTRAKYAGKVLVVIAGGSSVGQFAIQCGKLAGFGTIITTASLKHTDYLKSIGATHIIDRHIPITALGDEIKKITETPVELIFDAVSLPETQKAGLDALAPGGDLVIVLKSHVTPPDNKSVDYILGVADLPENRKLCIEMYSRLTKWVEDGDIKPTRFEVLNGGLNDVVPGLERLQNGEVSGYKLVIRPQDTA